MEKSRTKSFTGQVQLLHKTDKEFHQKLKQRLVLESPNVTNHFELIVSLFNEGVLCGGSNDLGATVGLKEMMAQLALMTACSQGADAVGGILNALEGSGNLQLISALRAWIKEDFGIVTDDDDLSEPITMEKHEKNKIEMHSSAIKLIDKISSLEGNDLMEQLKPLVFAIRHSGNEHILEEALEWLETQQARTKNYPIAVKSLANQRIKEETKTVISTFFEQAAPSNSLQKVATFNRHSDSLTKGTFALEFDSERMMTHFADSTVKLWNWQDNEEKTIKFGFQVKNVTCFQYDEEIIVLGSAEGTVYLFDAKTVEEKWSIRFDGSIRSLQFVESALVILVRPASGEHDQFWWVEISRSGMQLQIRRVVRDLVSTQKSENSGILMRPDRSFLYNSNRATIHDTKSRDFLYDPKGFVCYLEAPADIITMNMVDLTTTRYVVAGCSNGMICIWHTYFFHKQFPMKSFQGHTEAVVSLCAIRGHLLSLDKSRRLFMWSGYDVTHPDVRQPVPRVLDENFTNVTSLAAYERWFASCSSEDGVIAVWALPELWLRTG